MTEEETTKPKRKSRVVEALEKQITADKERAAAEGDPMKGFEWIKEKIK